MVWGVSHVISHPWFDDPRTREWRVWGTKSIRYRTLTCLANKHDHAGILRVIRRFLSPSIPSLLCSPIFVPLRLGFSWEWSSTFVRLAWLCFYPLLKPPFWPISCGFLWSFQEVSFVWCSFCNKCTTLHS